MMTQSSADELHFWSRGLWSSAAETVVHVTTLFNMQQDPEKQWICVRS